MAERKLKKSFVFKGIIHFTVLCFILTNFTLAPQLLAKTTEPANEEAVSAKPQAKSSSQPKKLPTAKDISIPADLGKVSKVYSASPGAPLIIHIQDLHTNYEAQKKLSKTLEYLAKNYGVSLILVEGGSRSDSLSFLRTYAPKDVRIKVAEKYLKEGKICGENYLDIISDDLPLDVFGIEKPELYDANMEAFLDIEKFSQKALNEVTSLKLQVDFLKEKIYSKALKEYDQKHKDFKDEKLDAVAYITYLNSKFPVSDGSELSKNLAIFNQLAQLEKQIDFNKVENEHQAVIEKLSGKLTKSDLQKLTKKALSVKEGKITAKDYYLYLKEIGQSNGINLTAKKEPAVKNIAQRISQAINPASKTQPYQNLINYIAYLELVASLDQDELFKEIKQLEVFIQDDLAKNEQQKELVKISYNLELLANLLQLKITPDDYDYFMAHQDEMKTANYIPFLKKNGAKVSAAKSLDSNLERLTSFYTAARQRDQAFVDNSIKAINNRLEEGAPKIAVLIAGGFHTEHITRMFKDKSYSYVVIAPKVTSEMDENFYHRVLRETYVPMSRDNEAETEELRPRNGGDVDETVRNIGDAIDEEVDAQLREYIEADSVVELVKEGSIYVGYLVRKVPDYYRMTSSAKRAGLAIVEKGKEVIRITDSTIVSRLDKLTRRTQRRVAYVKGTDRILGGQSAFIHTGTRDWYPEYTLARLLTADSDLLERIPNHEMRHAMEKYKGHEGDKDYPQLLADVSKLADEAAKQKLPLAVLIQLQLALDAILKDPEIAKFKLQADWQGGAPGMQLLIYIFEPTTENQQGVFTLRVTNKGTPEKPFFELALTLDTGYNQKTKVINMLGHQSLIGTNTSNPAQIANDVKSTIIPNIKGRKEFQRWLAKVNTPASAPLLSEEQLMFAQSEMDSLLRAPMLSEARQLPVEFMSEAISQLSAMANRDPSYRAAKIKKLAENYDLAGSKKLFVELLEEIRVGHLVDLESYRITPESDYGRPLTIILFNSDSKSASADYTKLIGLARYRQNMVEVLPVLERSPEALDFLSEMFYLIETKAVEPKNADIWLKNEIAKKATTLYLKEENPKVRETNQKRYAYRVADEARAALVRLGYSYHQQLPFAGEILEKCSSLAKLRDAILDYLKWGYDLPGYVSRRKPYTSDTSARAIKKHMGWPPAGPNDYRYFDRIEEPLNIEVAKASDPEKLKPAEIIDVGSGSPNIFSPISVSGNQKVLSHSLNRFFGDYIMGYNLWKETGGHDSCLIKFICVAEDIAIQIHLAGVEGKNEDFIIIETANGGRLMTALKNRESAYRLVELVGQIAREGKDTKVTTGQILTLIHMPDVKPGDMFNIRADMVHAFGRLIADAQKDNGNGFIMLREVSSNPPATETDKDTRRIWDYPDTGRAYRGGAPTVAEMVALKDKLVTVDQYDGRLEPVAMDKPEARQGLNEEFYGNVTQNGYAHNRIVLKSGKVFLPVGSRVDTQYHKLFSDNGDFEVTLYSGEKIQVIQGQIIRIFANNVKLGYSINAVGASAEAPVIITKAYIPSEEQRKDYKRAVKQKKETIQIQQAIITALKEAGIETNLSVDPNSPQTQYLGNVSADFSARGVTLQRDVAHIIAKSSAVDISKARESASVNHVMDHAAEIGIPDEIRKLENTDGREHITGINSTLFEHTNQIRQTGGHLQNTAFDLKRVIKGVRKQLIVYMGQDGKVHVDIFELKPGSWYAALPGTIDFVVGSSLIFGDGSWAIDEKALPEVQNILNIDPDFDLNKLMKFIKDDENGSPVIYVQEGDSTTELVDPDGNFKAAGYEVVVNHLPDFTPYDLSGEPIQDFFNLYRSNSGVLESLIKSPQFALQSARQIVEPEPMIGRQATAEELGLDQPDVTKVVITPPAPVKLTPEPVESGFSEAELKEIRGIEFVEKIKAVELSKFSNSGESDGQRKIIFAPKEAFLNTDELSIIGLKKSLEMLAKRKINGGADAEFMVVVINNDASENELIKKKVREMGLSHGIVTTVCSDSYDLSKPVPAEIIEQLVTRDGGFLGVTDLHNVAVISKIVDKPLIGANSQAMGLIDKGVNIVEPIKPAEGSKQIIPFFKLLNHLVRAYSKSGQGAGLTVFPLELLEDTYNELNDHLANLDELLKAA